MGRILGVGTDVVTIPDFERRMERSPGLEQSVFAPEESAYCRSMARPAQHFAARFAAKEAVLKALGTGWAEGVDFRDVVVVRDARGAPSVRLEGGAAARLEGRSARVHLSLSHAGETAMAVAVLEAGEDRDGGDS
ncbi:holo-ACP synthase [Myxococcota bacterium]|nr:holo-ACP synthase [Myxococcota bacterium]